MEKRELAKLDLEIRIGTREDTEHIVEFSYSLGMETEGDDCDKQIHRDGIQRLFENDRNETQRINNEGIYFVAFTEENQAAGMLIIKHQMNSYLGGIALYIDEVYVEKEYRKKGVLKTLFRRVKEEASKNPIIKAIRLWIHYDNKLAQNVYENLRMSAPDLHFVDYIEQE